MQQHLQDRILRRLESMSDERAYQVLDYIEFLESKYAERATAEGSPFTRFTEAVEDKLRAGRVSATTIAETVGLMNRAANLLNGALQATRAAANELVNTPAGTPPREQEAPPQQPGPARHPPGEERR
jgi:hypothetical protein